MSWRHHELRLIGRAAVVGPVGRRVIPIPSPGASATSSAGACDSWLRYLTLRGVDVADVGRRRLDAALWESRCAPPRRCRSAGSGGSCRARGCRGNPGRRTRSRGRHRRAGRPTRRSAGRCRTCLPWASPATGWCAACRSAAGSGRRPRRDRSRASRRAGSDAACSRASSSSRPPDSSSRSAPTARRSSSGSTRARASSRPRWRSAGARCRSCSA